MTERLYDIVDGILAVEQALIESGGEASPELEAALAADTQAFEDKLEQYARLVRNFEAQGQAIKREEEHLALRRAVRFKAAERLKGIMLAEMQRVGRPTVESDLFTIRIQKAGRPTIQWTDPDLPPPLGFQRHVPARVELDADLALAELKATGTLPDGFAWLYNSFLRIG